MRKYLLAAALAAFALPTTQALADPPPWAPAHGKRAKDAARYDSRGRYAEPVVITRSDNVWRGDDGRYHCRRSNGTTGLVIGAAAGALVGNQIDGGRDRAVGTIVGAAAGGLLGREIDRGSLHCQ